MTKEEKENKVSSILCGVVDARACEFLSEQGCKKFGKCRICEKTEEQLDYILSPNDKCTYLEACAGSGKTEVLGMKTAFEICQWDKQSSGIAVLTFTNEAANTIEERVGVFYSRNLSSVHYIGTFASFVHGYIAQKFGYMFYHRNDEPADRSFVVVDKSASVYNNPWLNNYRLAFPVPSNMEPIYANQIFFRASDKKLYIELGENNSKEISGYYNLPKMQECINIKREQKSNNGLYGFDYFKKLICDLKKKFITDGFATFEDMNVIANRCLKKDDIVKRLSMKFPLIMVDECQDLSFIELELLSLLKNAGSSIHYIGDLNQAIYSFKDAQPEYLKERIADIDFKLMRLSDNFRSCMNIVNVSCKLQSIDQRIIGHEENICGENAAIYFEYENDTEALKCFECLLNRNGISPKKAIVLTRTSNLKEKLIGGGSINYKKHAIINAIQLWRINTPESKKDALILLGWKIQRWLGSTGRKDNYYCPDTYDDVFRWRLMLRDTLKEFSISDVINDFCDKTYSEWYRSVKSDVLDIVDTNVKGVLNYTEYDLRSISFRTPNGTASSKIQMFAVNDDKLRVDTIHSVKGCSYDAVLLVSTSNRLGKTGYWENWVDNKDETSRFGYVASTRPRYLLAWAVPKLSDAQRSKIESIGLKRMSI